MNTTVPSDRPYALRTRARRVSALIRKESWQIVRDPSSVLIALVLPLVLLFLFGYGVSLDATRTRIGVVTESPDVSSRDLAAAFINSPYFDVEVATDRRVFDQRFARGDVHGLLVIPANFDASLRRTSRPPAIQLVVDGTEPNTAALVQGYAQGVVLGWTRARAAAAGHALPPSGAQDRMWFNPGRTSRYVLVPGSVAIVMALVGTLLTALVVAREWERGTMEALMATPVTAVELFIGKVIPYFFLGLGSVSVCTVVAVQLFGVPFRGSLLGLFTVCAAFLLPALGQGLLISAATRNQFLASQLALLSSFLPTFLLSGFLFEIGSMPRPIQYITQIVPARWLIPSLLTVFLAGDLWPLFLADISVMTVFGVVLLTLAARATKKRVA